MTYSFGKAESEAAELALTMQQGAALPLKAATEAPGFFAREVGGVPVWAIGAGVLVLGAGLVFVATRKKTAPAALAANRRRARLRRNAPIASTPEMQALYAEIEAEKAARSAPRRVAWTPMTLNGRR